MLLIHVNSLSLFQSTKENRLDISGLPLFTTATIPNMQALVIQNLILNQRFR